MLGLFGFDAAQFGIASFQAGSAFVLLLQEEEVAFVGFCLLFVLAMSLFVVLNFAMRADEHLAEETKGAGFFEGDAIFEEGPKDFRKDATNVFGRIERTRRLGKFLKKEFVFVGRRRLVDEAERGT